jgi:hypothetical protein
MSLGRIGGTGRSINPPYYISFYSTCFITFLYIIIPFGNTNLPLSFQIILLTIYRNVYYLSMLSTNISRTLSNWLGEKVFGSFLDYLFIYVEYTNYKAGLITFHNGRNIECSIVFYLYSLPILRLHYKKPLMAFGLSVLITVGLLLILKVPITKMKPTSEIDKKVVQK